MRNFKIEDFEGAGQYLVRTNYSPKEIKSHDNPGFLSTVTYKVGYEYRGKRGVHTTYLISMADGLIFDGYKYKDKWVYWEPSKKERKSSTEAGYRKLVKYLNDPKLCTQEMRFATQDEIIAVVNCQTHRWRN